MKILFIIAILSALILSGCTDAAKTEWERIVTEIAQVRCQKEFKCCGKSMMSKHYQTEKECRAYVKKMYAASYVNVEWVDLTWSEEKVTACEQLITSIKKISCTSSLEFNAAERMEEMYTTCEDLFVGTRELGDACGESIYCKPGLYCSDELNACTEYAELKEPCKKDGSILCNPEQQLYCNSDNICEAFPQEGQDCSVTQNCYENDSNVVCITDSSTNEQRCMKLPTEGEPCLNDRCDDTTFCTTKTSEDGTDSKICVAKKIGEKACDNDAECLSGICGETDGEEAGAVCLNTIDEVICTEYDYDNAGI